MEAGFSTPDFTKITWGPMMPPNFLPASRVYLPPSSTKFGAGQGACSYAYRQFAVRDAVVCPKH